jgi:hypothetical protein
MILDSEMENHNGNTCLGIGSLSRSDKDSRVETTLSFSPETHLSHDGELVALFLELLAFFAFSLDVFR